MNNTLISFTPLTLGQSYGARIAGVQENARVCLLIEAEEPISTLPHKGLDGHHYHRYRVRWTTKAEAI